MLKKGNLLKGPILPSLLRFATPFMLTAFVQMAYGLTDMMWIGRINSDAVAAVGIIGFLLWLLDSIGCVAQIGMGVELARAYGRGSREDTRKVFNAGIQLALVIALFFVSLFLLGLQLFVTSYRLPDIVNTYSYLYGYSVLPGMVFRMVNVCISQSHQSMGDSVTPFRINVLGLVVNMVLDPVFIFAFNLGILGAGLATSLAQVVVFLAFFVQAKQKGGMLAKFALFVPVPRSLWRRMIRLGFPVSLLHVTHAVISLFLNRFMAAFGAIAVAVYSVGTQIESIAWMTAEGFSGAITSMVAQNSGAGQWKRVKKTMKVGVLSTLSIGFGAMLIVTTFRHGLFGIFLPNNEKGIALGAMYLLILGLSQPFYTVETGAAACFNGLGKTVIPSVVSVVFNVLRIPIAYVLMPTYGVLGIWAAMSISSMLKGVLLTVALWVHSRRAHLDNPSDTLYNEY